MLLEIGLHFFIPKGFIHPLVAIVADIVLVLTGGVIQYGLMKLFYKFPLSKVAFGAAIERELLVLRESKGYEESKRAGRLTGSFEGSINN